MSNLRATQQTSRRADKSTSYKVSSIACATMSCYLCATIMLAGGDKCLYTNVLGSQCVFPIGLHHTSGGASGGASDALMMADNDGCTDIQAGIYDGMIGGVMADGGSSQEGVRQVGIQTQGWGGFRYPNQGTVEKPTQTNIISSQTNPISTKFSNPYACACVRKSFSGVGGYRYPDYVGWV